MANPAGGSTLEFLASQKARRMKAAIQLGLTPASRVPPQSKGLRGSVPPTQAATTSPAEGDVFLQTTREFFAKLATWQP